MEGGGEGDNIGQTDEEKKKGTGTGQICYSVRPCRPDIWMLRRFHGVERRTGETGRRGRTYRCDCRLYFVFLSPYLMGFCQTLVHSRVLQTGQRANKCSSLLLAYSPACIIFKSHCVFFLRFIYPRYLKLKLSCHIRYFSRIHEFWQSHEFSFVFQDIEINCLNLSVLILIPISNSILDISLDNFHLNKRIF